MQLGWQECNKYNPIFTFTHGSASFICGKGMVRLPSIRRGLSWFHDEHDFGLL